MRPTPSRAAGEIALCDTREQRFSDKEVSKLQQKLLTIKQVVDVPVVRGIMFVKLDMGHISDRSLKHIAPRVKEQIEEIFSTAVKAKSKRPRHNLTLA